MKWKDRISFAFTALRSHPLRTVLTVLGMAVGVGAVITLTALGEGARRYVLQEFVSMGTHILMIIPGKVETSGAMPWGGVVHDLTLEDYKAVVRLQGVKTTAPVVLATEAVAFGDRKRSVAVLGTTPEYTTIRHLSCAYGRFFTLTHPREKKMVMVLGAKVARELFPTQSPLGKRIDVGIYRFRVVGVLKPRGRVLGIDFDDMVFIPVQSAMEIFDRSSLFRILVEPYEPEGMDALKKRIATLLKNRHRADDVTLQTQEAMMQSFSMIMNLLTLAVSAIAVISMAVAGLGIMNLMLITITERTEEIGLLGALGALPRTIRFLFLTESFTLACMGALFGVGGGLLLIHIFRVIIPTFPATPPLWAIPSAILLSFAVGIFFGWFPAWRASKIDPIQALLRR